MIYVCGDFVYRWFVLLQILQYEGIAAHDVRKKRAKEIYDKFILVDKLAMSSVSALCVVCIRKMFL